jgi:hypothetical protein
MEVALVTGGERASIRCAVPWVAERIRDGADGCLAPGAAAEPTVLVSVESTRERFETHGWSRLSRDAWSCDGHVVVEDVATSGFDMHLWWEGQVPEVIFRWRPPRTTRAASLLLRKRARLLVRSVILQYPFLWIASTRGRAPIHAPAVSAGSPGPAILVGASGVGKTTLVENEIAGGGQAVGDNLAVGDGRVVWGIVEPMRTQQGSGRRVTHGRREAHLDHRVPSMEPRLLVALGRAAEQRIRVCEPGAAARALAASTYAAGELRRYWPLHALLALGTGLGPPHPPVTAVADAFASRLLCLTVDLPAAPEVGLARLLADEGVSTWT